MEYRVLEVELPEFVADEMDAHLLTLSPAEDKEAGWMDGITFGAMIVRHWVAGKIEFELMATVRDKAVVTSGFRLQEGSRTRYFYKPN